MTKRKIVVALGGNAILKDDPSATAQQETIKETATSLVELVKNGDELVVTHGNGPQVGNLLLQNIEADSEKNPAFPLDTLVAMTEGSIGYWMQNALQNELNKNGLEKDVVSIITQVVVDKNDPAFNNPSKPIGPFYSEEEAKAEMKNAEVTFKEDAGRGWRKVVPSPKPIAIKEIKSIQSLIEAGHLVVAAGGGGIPVIEDEKGNITGKEAVIDKDFASEVLAKLIDANLFIILTDVDNVYINYNQPDEKSLETVTVKELEGYIADNQFAEGSMLPKIEAAINFINNKPESKAVITSLKNLKHIGNGEVGTVIIKK